MKTVLAVTLMQNSLNLEEANKEVKMCFDELKNKGIKNDIILT